MAGMENNPYESPETIRPASEPEKPAKGLTAPELFGVVVRALGLWFLCYAVFDLAAYWFPHDPTFDKSRYLMGAAEYAATGIVPFLFPNLFVRIAYRPGQD